MGVQASKKDNEYMFKINEQVKSKLAIIDDNDKITFEELELFSQSFSKILAHRSVIFILCENTIAALAGYIACIDNRIVPLLLDSNLDQELYNSLLEAYAPQYIWMPMERTASLKGMEKIYEAHGYVLMETGKPNYPIYGELASLMTTSGTTGDPKVVRHSYMNLETSAKNVSGFLGLKDSDRGIVQLPIQYTMGLSTACSHLFVGATVLLTKRSLTESEFWKFFEEKKATTFTGVPFSYEVLARLRFFRKEHPTLRLLAQGGGKMNDELFAQVASYSETYDKQFFATFGTTETTARLSYLAPDLAGAKTGSIGDAISQGELSLIDPMGNVICENNVEGELVYRGPNVMLGYAVSKRDLSKSDEYKGCYITGDLAIRDMDGYYFIKGRKKRFLKLYGLRVSLDYSEILLKDYLSAECACTGNDKGMHIFITVKGRDKEVIDFISRKIGIPYNAFSVHVVQKIPRKNTGKIDYSALDLESVKH